MTVTEIILRIVNRIMPLRVFFQYYLRGIILKGNSRESLNKRYNRLTYREKAVFHVLFAKIFRDQGIPDIEGTWVVNFAEKDVHLPLSGESLWLNWDTAISIVGNDIEIKSFYEKLITSEFKPNCFFDVGGNYGTHSVLLLKHGIRTFTFEPNKDCAPYFDRMLTLNNLEANLENVAVGEEKGKAVLTFPKDDTWLGSLSNSLQKDLETDESIISREVDVITLDGYAELNNLSPDLIKIDTEGFEINVLQGAKGIMAKSDLIIVFECRNVEEKTRLAEEFEKSNYGLYDLKGIGKGVLSREGFINSKGNNFVGISPKHPIHESISTFAL